MQIPLTQSKLGGRNIVKTGYKGFKRDIIDTGTMMMVISMQETWQIDCFSCINEHKLCLFCEKLMESKT